MKSPHCVPSPSARVLMIGRWAVQRCSSSWSWAIGYVAEPAMDRDYMIGKPAIQVGIIKIDYTCSIVSASKTGFWAVGRSVSAASVGSAPDPRRRRPRGALRR
jgi:hypothetical protein